MNIFFRSFFCLIFVFFVGGCFRNDLRTAEFRVPKLAGQECLNHIAAKLRGVDGVSDVRGDFSSRTVTVTFDGLKLAIKNIEIYIADSGFDVNERPGDEAAKNAAAFPAGCR